jgi:hypothetical protein
MHCPAKLPAMVEATNGLLCLIIAPMSGKEHDQDRNWALILIKINLKLGTS